MRKSNRRRLSPTLSLAILAGGTIACGFFPIGQEAPEECGFPAGTALSFAGRSTTAELGVQEVQGDAMSDDPADIYVTRDAFDQGELHGRLLCAIYVNEPGFVELTVHPADVEPPPEPTPPATAPPSGIAKADALEIARSELPAGEDWEVGVLDAGPLEQMLPGGRETHDWPPSCRPTSGCGESSWCAGMRGRT